MISSRISPSRFAGNPAQSPPARGGFARQTNPTSIEKPSSDSDLMMDDLNAKLSRQKFGFRVVLAGVTQASEGLAHALYEAGCDDTSVGSRDGIVSVQFVSESTSLVEAMLSAREQVSAAGYTIERIELDRESLDAIALA